MCEHRLLPLTEDSLPCEDLSSPLGGPRLDPATLEGEGPPGPRRNHVQVPVLKTHHPDALPTESELASWFSCQSNRQGDWG